MSLVDHLLHQQSAAGWRGSPPALADREPAALDAGRQLWGGRLLGASEPGAENLAV